MAFFDFNVTLNTPLFASASGPAGGGGGEGLSKKQKKKANKQQHHNQQQQQASPSTAKGKERQIDVLDRIPKQDKDELQSRVKDLHDLGYTCIALNHVVHNRVDPALHSNPFYDPDHASRPAPSTSHMPPTISLPAFPHLSSSGASSSSSSSSRNTFHQLNRLTLILDDSSSSSSKGGSNSSSINLHQSTSTLASYDLLSIRPLSSTQFNLACLTHTELKPGISFDIISLDLSSSPRLPFYLRRSTVGKAVENGAVFEVCYGDALVQQQGGGAGDENESSGGTAAAAAAAAAAKKRDEKLRNLISNTRDLLRVTSGGKGVILSSGACSVLGLRSPSDVVNLAAVFGFHPTRAREALGETCRRLWVRAQTRRSWRGVVGVPRIVMAGEHGDERGEDGAGVGAQGPDPEKDMLLDGGGGGAAGGVKRKEMMTATEPQQKQQRQQQQQHGTGPLSKKQRSK